LPRIDEYPEDGKFNIKAVSQQTGLPPVTLRAWERRYKILNPQRAENGYRLYSEQDVAVLYWLKDRLDAGLSISLAVADLRSITRKGMSPEVSLKQSAARPRKIAAHPVDYFAQRLHEFLIHHNESAAAAEFESAADSYSLSELFESILVPVLVNIGDDWFHSRISVATEHFASAFIRTRLMAIFQSLPTKQSLSHILVGSAPEELHEIGPLMVAVLLREASYKVEYLGPDLPLQDLVFYAREEKPKMIILSATLKESTRELAGFEHQLSSIRPKPIFGFGGPAYLQHPEIIAQTEGVYLGETITQSVKTVQDVLAGKKRMSLAG